MLLSVCEIILLSQERVGDVINGSLPSTGSGHAVQMAITLPRLETILPNTLSCNKLQNFEQILTMYIIG